MRGDRTPLQELSKKVFNSEHLLAVVRVLLTEHGLLTVDELSKRAGVPRSSAHKEIHFLRDLGAVQRVVLDRTSAFQPVDGPFWTWCTDLIGSVSDKEIGPVAKRR